MRSRLVVLGALALLLLMVSAPFVELALHLVVLCLVLLTAALVGQSIAKVPRWLVLLWFFGGGR